MHINSYAKVTGNCANCHTMHYSQNGTRLSSWGSSGPYTWLNTNSCLGCHTSTSGNTIIELGGSRIPIVFNTGGYPSEPLAGGNFYKPSLGGSENDKYGHNVEGISNADNNLVYVPGKHFGGNDQLSISDCYDCHSMGFDPGYPGIPFTIARTGDVLICRDCHTQVKHHANDSATIVDGTGGWYRFIYYVKGIEDSDWEKTVSPTDHNEYQGETSANDSISVSDAGCGCHGDFHALRNPSGVGSSSPWLKHPADIALPNSGEYSAYTTYNPVAPVARPDLSGYSGPSETVTPGTDQVMCLSCHRSHGSDQLDILRWDYSTMVAGGGGSGGCFTCHTQKNQTP
jgi:hypothetical protein